jgi:hypothetical protein
MSGRELGQVTPCSGAWQGDDAIDLTGASALAPALSLMPNLTSLDLVSGNVLSGKMECVGGRDGG